ncbi:MAG TPA: hypothetical protein VIM73_06985, partial [Polyangiaceae bacterium]
MALNLEIWLRVARNVVAGAVLAGVAASCASGDVAEPGELAARTEQEQRLPVCGSRICENRGPCVSVTCSALNTCVYTPLKNGTECLTAEGEAGTCSAGLCCVCGATMDKLGNPICIDCDDRKPCTVDSCVKGLCDNSPVRDGTACPSGVCIGGACCAGCLDKEAGGVCRPGGANNAAYCGVGGATCESCND